MFRGSSFHGVFDLRIRGMIRTQRVSSFISRQSSLRSNSRRTCHLYHSPTSPPSSLLQASSRRPPFPSMDTFGIGRPTPCLPAQDNFQRIVQCDVSFDRKKPRPVRRRQRPAPILLISLQTYELLHCCRGGFSSYFV